jgi:hypothetical protein
MCECGGCLTECVCGDRCCPLCGCTNDCLPGCIYQDGHDGDCTTDEDVAEGRLRARDYEGWATL